MVEGVEKMGKGQGSVEGIEAAQQSSGGGGSGGLWRRWRRRLEGVDTRR